MFRNKYLQTYKTTISSNSNIQQLLCHFSYVYATMGSILQDIQYTIGSFFSSNTLNIGKKQADVKYGSGGNGNPSQQSQFQNQNCNSGKSPVSGTRNKNKERVQIDLLQNNFIKIEGGQMKVAQQVQTQLSKPWNQNKKKLGMINSQNINQNNPIRNRLNNYINSNQKINEDQQINRYKQQQSQINTLGFEQLFGNNSGLRPQKQSEKRQIIQNINQNLNLNQQKEKKSVFTPTQNQEDFMDSLFDKKKKVSK